MTAKPATRAENADYLIVGAGAAGMSFADVLLSKSNATMVIADRRHAPGGHWVDAYPFARLHMPSACYGVDSMAMGEAGSDPEGDPTLYERASAAEICAYYDRVLHQRFLPSGRVRFLPGMEHLGDGRLRSVLTGDEVTVVHGKLVDATYTEGAIPATSPPPFEVEAGVRCIPVGELPQIGRAAEGFVVIGAGKTGQDACLWLLARDVSPERIRWARPRDPWIQTRRSAQPGPGLPETIELYACGIEAAAQAVSQADLFRRLEHAGVLIRIDPAVTPTTYHGAIISDWEVGQLRRIGRVIRKGHVRRIEPTRILLDEGEVETSPDTLHIHCAASALGGGPVRPVFDGNRITIQNLRYGLLPLSAGIIGFLEATRADDAEKNAFCAPLRYNGLPSDWLRQRLADLENGARWRAAPDLDDWIEGTRLSISAGARALRDQSPMRESIDRLSANAGPATRNLRALLAGEA